jgi:hypothetical protein
MAILTRRQVTAAVRTALEQIRTGNGFLTDVGQQVFYALELPVEYNQPCIIFRLDPGADFKTVNIQHETTLHLEISGFLWDREPQEALVDLLEDFARAIGSNQSFGLRGLTAQPIRFEEFTESEGETCARLVLYVDVTYRSALWKF